MNDVTDLWKDFQAGRQYLDSINLFTRVETCHNFVNGDQWNGLKYGKERPPQLNILLPIMKQSTALVGQNLMTIQYTSMNYGKNRAMLLDVCDKLNSYAAKLWERLKIDKYSWDILQDAYIGGDAFLYFYDDTSASDGRILCEIVDTTNVMLGDEQQPDIQKQPYILIVQRKNIDEVKDMARSNGVPEEEIEGILPDSDTELQINGEIEVKNNKKLTVIAKLWKEDGCVHIMRATKTVVIQPDTEIKGMSRYPVAKYTWKPRKGLARGDGDVWDKIPNQISINKSLFRLEQAVKSSSYPIKVYRNSALTAEQVAKLERPGRAVAVSSHSEVPVNSLIQYLNPANISPYAASYWQNLITLTKELAGAGDNLENVNPEQASGTAIQAAMEAKSLNVNMQVAAYKQFVEDIAWIWFDMTVAYNPNGLVINEDEPDSNGDYSYTIPVAELKALDVDIKVEATHTGNTWAAIRDAQLKNLFDTQRITFEEYVEALGDDSTMPKEVFKKIIESRKEAAEQQAEYMQAEAATLRAQEAGYEMQNM